MKALLRKNFMIMPKKYYFDFLSTALALIPTAGITLFTFILLGYSVFTNYLTISGDDEFSALLPVTRKDIVYSRISFYVIIQLIAFLFAGIFATIGHLFIPWKINPESTFMLTNINTFGLIIMVFAIFNYLTIPTHFKKVDEEILKKPKFWLRLIIIVVVCFLPYIVMRLLFIVPEIEAILNSLDPSNFGYQLIVLALGIVMYIISFILTCKKSLKMYNETDIRGVPKPTKDEKINKQLLK